MNKYFILGIFLALCFCKASAQLSSAQIDSVVELTLKTFDVPGMQVGIVKDGQLIHAKGYGYRSLRTKEKVDENTIFGIASNSKAFTAAALAILIEEKKLTWDTKVTDVLPEFKLYDSYVTTEFTVRDLLTHRSGLGLGAGDLMFFPDSNTFTKTEIIHNLRYLKPVSSFRTKFDYDNLLYIVAGEIVAKVSGMSWEDFIQKRIFGPLEITMSAPSYHLLKLKSNVIDPHAPISGVVQTIRRDWSNNSNAAGGINANVIDMSKWLTMLMNGGKYGKKLENILLSEKSINEMWTPQTILPVRNPGSYNTHFNSYGLGWFISDVKGYKQMNHTGGLAGTVTQTTLLPELGLAIMVYTNQQSGAAFNAVTNTIKDSYLGITGKDRVQEYHLREKQNFEEADQIQKELQEKLSQSGKKTSICLPSEKIIGVYSDKWFGEVEISMQKNELWFASKKSLMLNGPLTYLSDNTYVVKWVERSFDADCYVTFALNKDGQVANMVMEAISPLTDFSFDFQDLYFEKNKEHK